MVNTLSFRTNKDCNVFCFSDTHILHSQNFILQPRGFSSPEEGKETIINNWNSKVTNDDICFLLGDTVVGAGQKSGEVFQEVLNRLNYKELYLASGNHFAAYRQRFNEELTAGNRIDEYYRLSFCPVVGKIVHLIPNYYEIVVDKQLIILSHYPIYSWRDIGKGSIMLHGHCHGRINGHLKGKILDMGPESIGNFPLSYKEIKSIMDSKAQESPDYH